MSHQPVGELGIHPLGDVHGTAALLKLGPEFSKCLQELFMSLLVSRGNRALDLIHLAFLTTEMPFRIVLQEVNNLPQPTGILIGLNHLGEIINDFDQVLMLIIDRLVAGL